MLTPTSVAPLLRIAIYRTSSLGDMILATACLDFLDQLSIPTEITWVGRGAALDVITQAWPNVKSIEIERTASLADLHRATASLQQVHLFIDLQCNLRSQWLARNLKLAYGVPFFSAEKAQLRRSRMLLEARLRGRRKPLPPPLQRADRLQFDTMVDAIRRALKHHFPTEMLDGSLSIRPRPRLPIPETLDPPWRKELRYGTWLGVAPGAAHPTKQAPLDMMVDILRKVQHRDFTGDAPLGLVFFGDNNDRNHARTILDQLNWGGPVLNLAGRLSLWESAVALNEARCLLSNDSSLSHIAEAVETPTAVLFGPTVEGFGFAPRMPQSKAFSASIGCRPCSKHGKLPCRYGDQLCFTSLSTEDIASHLVSLLQTGRLAKQHAKPQLPRTETSPKQATETPSSAPLRDT